MVDVLVSLVFVGVLVILARSIGLKALVTWFLIPWDTSTWVNMARRRQILDEIETALDLNRESLNQPESRTDRGRAT